MKEKTILVLGSNGMTGRTVFEYLKRFPSNKVFGTSREKIANPRIFHFCVKTYKKEFRDIINRTKKIDYVINCIGILTNYNSLEELIRVNSLFPHQLSELSNAYNFKLIHISSDAIFSESSKKVFEDTLPCPNSMYGASKLLGEPDFNSLTVRTSLIGFDPVNKKGLIEWVKSYQGKKINGYSNQKWSGCTTLQFSMLCNQLVNGGFEKIRTKTSVIHFTPIKNTTKYSIIKTIRSVLKLPIEIKKFRGKEISRLLDTKYSSLFMDRYVKPASLRKSLIELIQFENSIIPL